MWNNMNSTLLCSKERKKYAYLLLYAWDISRRMHEKPETVVGSPRVTEG